MVSTSQEFLQGHDFLPTENRPDTIRINAADNHILPDPFHTHKELDNIVYNHPSQLSSNRYFQVISNRTLAYICICIFVIASITAGVFVISFTAGQQPTQQCILAYQPTLKLKPQFNSLTNSIGVGDFNNDGNLDMVITNYGSHTIGIFLGKGDGTFQSQITHSTGNSSHPYFTLTHDFNDDTLLDIIVANFGSNSLGRFFGNGDGSFGSQQIFELNSTRPIYVAIGNLNNDSLVDVVVANYGTDSIGILLGLTDGSLTSPMTYSTGYDSDPRSIVVADFNNDGLQDIAVANYGTNNMGIFFGYGNGSFASQIVYSTGLGSRPYSIIAADFNKDTRLDIAVTNAGEGSVGVFFGDGDRNFRYQQILSTGNGSSPCSIAVANINNDSYIDIIVTNSGSNTIIVTLGDRFGNFSSTKIYSTGYGSSPQHVTIGDFNNDNRIDLAVANNGSNEVGIFLSDKSISYRDSNVYSTGYSSHPLSIAIGDLNQDHIMDLVVANSNADNVGILLGFANGSFDKQITYPTGYQSLPISVALDHLNNDTCLDIAVVNRNADNFGILLGYCNGTFTNQSTFSTGARSSPISIAIGDFNNDSHLDIVVTNSLLDAVELCFGIGDGTFLSPIMYPTGAGSSPWFLVAHDLNNDNILDIVVITPIDDNIGVFFGLGNGTFTSPILYSIGEQSNPIYACIADINNDSFADIIVPAQSRDYVMLLFGTSNGSFGNQTTIYVGYSASPLCVVVGDLNNDNILDIIVGNGNADYLSVYRGYGKGKFSVFSPYPLNGTNSVAFVALSDFNNDARLDIIVADPLKDYVLTLLGYDAGLFNDMVGFSTSYALYPSSITFNDFNRDNQIDVGVSNFAGNNINIYLGYKNGSFLINNSISTGDQSRPQMIVSTDLNNDNINDIAVANTGKNNIGILIGYGNGSFLAMKTLSTGSDSRPTSLAIGDVNHDHRPDIVVANSGSNNVGVILGFDIGAFTEILPIVVYSKFSSSSYQHFAVGDINNDNNLDIVFVEDSTNILGIALNYGNGTFAQPIVYTNRLVSEPIFVSTGDFNNDNKTDIVIANSGDRSVLILLGDDFASFENKLIFSFDSNVIPKSVIVGDFNNDNQSDLIVSTFGEYNIALLLGCGNGTFKQERTYATNNQTSKLSLAAGDFNNDSLSDVVFADSGRNTINILLGVDNGTFIIKATYTTDPGISPISVAVGDFDNDVHLDILVVNYDGVIIIFFGTGDGRFPSRRSFSIDSRSRPASVSVGDLNNDGRLDIAVACTFEQVEEN